MNGKVKCTCGWSWNKSDSSKKDMYICHECGRDNSNNMKNGGWLDSYEDGGTMQEHQENYNDSSVSLPEGYVGEGYNTKGRNYSPAWGGQFQDGGELIPIAQNGRATRADSLAVYNNTKAVDEYFKKQKYKKEKLKDSKEYKDSKKFINSWVNEAQKNLNDAIKQKLIPGLVTQSSKNKNIAEAKSHLNSAKKELSEKKDDVNPKKYLKKLKDSREFFNKKEKDTGSYVDEQGNFIEGKPSAENFYSPIDENKFYQREQSQGFLDLRSPMPLYDKRITPQYLSVHMSPDAIKQSELVERLMKTENKKEINKIEKQLKDIKYADNVEMYEYDPLAVMPFDMVPPEQIAERIRKYGTSGVPASYIDANKEKLNLDPKLKQEVIQPDLPRVEAINLPPMQQLQSMSAPTTSDVVRQPKSYNISRKTYNMKGLNDYYTTDEEGVDYERAMLQKSAADAYNRDILKRYGPQNEYRTPKSAADAAERLKQLRSEFTMTPNYQMGGSVYPVNYVPKAQDGNIIPSDLPDPVNGIIYDPEGERTYYDDRLDRIVLTPSSDFAPRQSVINHEKFHKYQFDNLLSNYDIAHKEAVPLFKKPSMVSTDEEYYKFHDRKGREAQEDIKNVKSNYPEFTFVPDEVLFNKIIDREQYSDPFTLEGGAQEYENSLNKFQMGGSIPGAVGFSYARTQSPAPSNGPYAKKTKASAQKGKDIPKLDVSKLDLKNLPKSTGYAWADDIVKKNKKGLEKIKEIKTKVDNKKIADIKKQYNIDDATAKKWYDNSKNLKQEQAEIRPYTPQSTLSKTWEVLTNPMTAFGYAARNEDLPDNFSRGERNNLDMATDIINPAAWANYGARGLSDYSNVPGQLMEGDFTGAGESTLSGTLNLLGAIPLGQELKAIAPAAIKTLPKAKNIKDALGTFRGIPTERSLPRLAPEELKAYRQVQEIGRMRATNKPISEQYRYAINQNLPEEHLQRVFGRGREEIQNILPNEVEAQALRDANPIPISERFNLERAPRAPRPLRSNDLTSISSEDIARAAQRGRLREMMGRWDDDINRIGGGVDPEAQNAVLSYSDDYRDFMEGDTSGEYLTPVSKAENFTNRVGDALEQFGGAANRITESQVAKFQNKLGQVISDYPYYEGPVLENVPSLSLSSSGSLKNVSNKVGTQSFSGISPGDVFTGSLNTSHSSYLPQLKQVFRYNEGTPQFFGYKPMNSLGFLSNFNYSADDIAKYLNTEIDDQIRRGIVPDNILRPYATNKYQNVQLPHYGIKQNPLTHREGGVIKDNRGQWAYPGEITEINSNDITMQGVPYNVLGISDTGDTKLMKPGKNYKFKGKKVTEYPMAKNGLRQEQKGLVNLDQLTNFTNYNTKQPGGWLDKY